ncbi:SET domain-containing protein [Daldinia loculata]|uniref:SET domain-containing protein n=1 Tax=Daldinia loculata TaxID=103429 RepID=UPI0020C481DA|nr:SET domain-containing protein [Daldinia loculata]KAI1648377.1 SET domain-containing protein [Daldinia loculata]
MAAREFKMLNSIDVRPSEGRGFGLFAKANIPANTIISSETATIYGPPSIRSRSDEQKVNVFCDAFASASESNRSRLDSHAWNPEQYEQHKDLYNHFDKWLKNYMRSSGSYEPGFNRTEAVMALIKAYSIFWINASGTPDNGAAVYSTFARSNHSCRPNATWRYRGDPPYHLEMVTECDIPAGEEVTVSYDNLSRLKLDERQKLLSNWGFTCKCERCTEEEYMLGL